MTDTSAEAVERLAEFFLARSVYGFVYGGDDPHREWADLMKRRAADTTATLRALVAERDAAVKAVERHNAAAFDWNLHLGRVEAERDAARASEARMRRVVDAARVYYDGYAQDEASSPCFCVDQEQHEAAQEFRDSLAALARDGGGA